MLLACVCVGAGSDDGVFRARTRGDENAGVGSGHGGCASICVYFHRAVAAAPLDWCTLLVAVSMLITVQYLCFCVVVSIDSIFLFPLFCVSVSSFLFVFCSSMYCCSHRCLLLFACGTAGFPV